ncbi:MAG: mechanosensitive ion channel family protein [Planctomycetota bacterium]
MQEDQVEQGAEGAQAEEAGTAESAMENAQADGAEFIDSIQAGDFETALGIAMPYVIAAVKILLIVFIALLVAAWVKRLVRGALTKAKVDATLSKFFGTAAKWAVMIVAGIAILGEFGIETASFAVLIGSLGLAVGLAFQGTLSNIASGVMLLIFRPFGVGDVISAGGVTGKVDEIELFTTTLDTPDNRRIIVPNSSIFGSTIENISHHGKRRVDVAVGVDYPASIDKTRAVLQTAADSIEQRIPEDAAVVYLVDLGDSAVNWAVRVWVPSAEYWGVREELTKRVKEGLDAAGIGIPFPQMDVHLYKQGDG